MHHSCNIEADCTVYVDMQDAPAQPECTLDDPWTSSDPDSYMRQLCAPGYYGPVCSLCISSGDVTYGRVGALQCQACRRPVTIISAYIASALLVLAWLSYTIHLTLVENEEAAAGHDDPQYASQLIRVRSGNALTLPFNCFESGCTCVWLLEKSLSTSSSSGHVARRCSASTSGLPVVPYDHSHSCSGVMTH